MKRQKLLILALAILLFATPLFANNFGLASSPRGYFILEDGTKLLPGETKLIGGYVYSNQGAKSYSDFGEVDLMASVRNAEKKCYDAILSEITSWALSGKLLAEDVIAWQLADNYITCGRYLSVDKVTFMLVKADVSILREKIAKYEAAQMIIEVPTAMQTPAVEATPATPIEEPVATTTTETEATTESIATTEEPPVIAEEEAVIEVPVEEVEKKKTRGILQIGPTYIASLNKYDKDYKLTSYVGGDLKLNLGVEAFSVQTEFAMGYKVHGFLEADTIYMGKLNFNLGFIPHINITVGAGVMKIAPFKNLFDTAPLLTYQAGLAANFGVISIIADVAVPTSYHFQSGVKAADFKPDFENLAVTAGIQLNLFR